MAPPAGTARGVYVLAIGLSVAPAVKFPPGSPNWGVTPSILTPQDALVEIRVWMLHLNGPARVPKELEMWRTVNFANAANSHSWPLVVLPL